MTQHERGRKRFKVYSNLQMDQWRTMKTIYFEMEMWWMYYGISSAVSIGNSILKCKQMNRTRLYFCSLTCDGPHESDQSGHSRGLWDSLLWLVEYPSNHANASRFIFPQEGWWCSKIFQFWPHVCYNDLYLTKGVMFGGVLFAFSLHQNKQRTESPEKLYQCDSLHININQ